MVTSAQELADLNKRARAVLAQEIHRDVASVRDGTCPGGSPDLGERDGERVADRFQGRISRVL